VLTASAGLQANIDTLNGIHDKVIATNAADLEEPQAAISAKMVELTGLRNEANIIAQEIFRVSSTQTDNRRLLGSLQSLNEREMSLPKPTPLWAALVWCR